MANRAERRFWQKKAGGKESVAYGRKPIDALSADELFKELVDDAVVGVVTPVERQVPALIRIASLKRMHVDAVIEEFFEAAKERKGNSLIPGINPLKNSNMLVKQSQTGY